MNPYQQLIKTLLLTLFVATSSLATISDTYENQKKSWEAHKNLVNDSDYKQLKWRNVGPIVQGGRVVAVKRSLQNDSVLYLAYASGGVWKSVDNGITFNNVTDYQMNQIVGAFSIDPNNDQVLCLVRDPYRT